MITCQSLRLKSRKQCDQVWILFIILLLLSSDLGVFAMFLGMCLSFLNSRVSWGCGRRQEWLDWTLTKQAHFLPGPAIFFHFVRIFCLCLYSCHIPTAIFQGLSRILLHRTCVKKKKSFWFVRYKFRVSDRVNRDYGPKNSSFLIWMGFSSFLPGMWLDIWNSC